jgi:hypothetical protein
MADNQSANSQREHVEERPGRFIQREGDFEKYLELEERLAEEGMQPGPLFIRLAKLGGRRIRVWASRDGAYWPAAGDFDLDRLLQGRIYQVEVNADGRPSPVLELEANEAPETEVTWHWPRQAPGAGGSQLWRP